MRSCAQSSQRSTWPPSAASGAAGLDRRHDLQLAEAHMAGVGLLSPRRLHGRERRRRPQGCDPWAAPCGRRQAGGDRLARLSRPGQFQRALDVADRVDGDAGVERGRLQLGVAEENTWITRMSTFCSSRWVAKLWLRVRRDPLGDPGRLRPQRGRRAPGWRADIGLTGFMAREQPGLRPRRAPPVAQQFEQLRREHLLRSPRCPLPCSTRSVMRWLSRSDTFSATTSEHPQASAVGDAERGLGRGRARLRGGAPSPPGSRRPAPYAVCSAAADACDPHRDPWPPQQWRRNVGSGPAPPARRSHAPGMQAAAKASPSAINRLKQLRLRSGPRALQDATKSNSSQGSGMVFVFPRTSPLRCPKLALAQRGLLKPQTTLHRSPQVRLLTCRQKESEPDGKPRATCAVRSDGDMSSTLYPKTRAPPRQPRPSRRAPLHSRSVRHRRPAAAGEEGPGAAVGKNGHAATARWRPRRQGVDDRGRRVSADLPQSPQPGGTKIGEIVNRQPHEPRISAEKG